MIHTFNQVGGIFMKDRRTFVEFRLLTPNLQYILFKYNKLQKRCDQTTLLTTEKNNKRENVISICVISILL